MPFFRKCNHKNNNQKKGIMTVSRWTSPPIRPNCNSSHMQFLKIKKRAPFFSSPKGSLTVEACLVLPLLLFFCIQLMSIISLIRLHSSMEAALHQTVSALSVSAYLINASEKEGISAKEGERVDRAEITALLEKGAGSVFVKNQVVKKAGKEYLEHSMIQGGSSGIFVTDCQILSDNKETIDVSIAYKVKPFVDILGFSGFTMGNRCKMKAWTGYPLEEKPWEKAELEEEIVYITETGTVYHKRTDCTHLKLSIQTVGLEGIGELRNQEGRKYYPCETCHPVSAGSAAYITTQGNRYHGSLECSGLKRTVYAVLISQTGGREPCSRCGAG